MAKRKTSPKPGISAQVGLSPKPGVSAPVAMSEVVTISTDLAVSKVAAGVSGILSLRKSAVISISGDPKRIVSALMALGPGVTVQSARLRLSGAVSAVTSMRGDTKPK
jgi:hypothetical protein